MLISPRKVMLLAITLIGMLLIQALPAAAQNRIIKGTVTDENDKPLQNVQISIQGTDVARQYNVKTDKKGQYLYMGIPAGQYRVVARMKGYEPDFVSNLSPTISAESVANFKLKPGPDRKLSFELSPEEQEKAKADQAKAESKKKMAGEVKVLFDGGLALAQAGKYDEAIVEYKKALAIDPEQPYIEANMADAYSKANNLDEALAAYQRATALKPDDPAIMTNLGVILGKMGKTAESQEAFKKAAAMNPAAAGQNYYNLGATLVNSGKMPEAADAFRQAIAADPNMAEAYYQLGMCLSGNDATIPDAIKALQKYIEIGKSPEQVEVAKQIIAALSAKK
jgi:tetratricopeptide (TPR) repeat protein